MDLTYWLIIVFWAAFTIASFLIGRSKGRAVLGFWLGLFFGLIGVITMLILKPKPMVPLDA